MTIWGRQVPTITNKIKKRRKKTRYKRTTLESQYPYKYGYRDPLRDSLNVQILSVQYGYQDCLGIRTTISTSKVTDPPPPCTDTETRTDNEKPLLYG